MGLKSVSVARFWTDLTKILPEIAKAEYVAIDFEMTGIEPRRAPKIHKPTKEEIYRRAKEATETFSIVQFGITCIIFDDDENNTIRLQSYNFNVSPLFDDSSCKGVDIIARTLDRTLTLSYKTMMFLKRNRIRIEDAYDGGIQYLSRAEEEEITPELFATQKHSRDNYIILEKQKPETKEFHDETVAKIRAWEESKDDPDQPSYFNITNPNGGPLNRFQRRLVYQILETEFDGKYGAMVEGNFFMQITEKNAEKEEKNQLEKTSNLERAIAFQRGLRYIVEALVGGDFAKDVWSICQTNRGMDDKDWETILQDSESKLKKKRPILLGHNMFYDLCFMHSTFIGPLPNTFDEFDRIVHDLFPRIMDTKYILKRDDNEMMPSRGLEEIFVDTDHHPVPFTLEGEVVHAARELHLANEHQAGHDSYKTSVVFVKEMWIRVADEEALEKDKGNRKVLYKHQLLQWDNYLVHGYANKVRVGNAGLWNIGKLEQSEVYAK
ncbi:hypothetical protein Sste5346_002501 [Sporothrix stenoceras]|uniref:Uncharacterized protein n=1 Tax=Sporothrix stenoceras TaxID=5173 RepID=A0ABR3ZJE6_9PEZI